MLRFIARTRFWARIGRIHTRIYESTGGRIGLNAGGLQHLLLTTTGRKTGEPRTVPLTFLRDGDEIVLVASNGGADRHPAWWLNLERDGHARVRLGREQFDVVARRAEGVERTRLWERLESYNPFYRRYADITDRDIPVVVLSRVDGGR